MKRNSRFFDVFMSLGIFQMLFLSWQIGSCALCAESSCSWLWGHCYVLIHRNVMVIEWTDFQSHYDAIKSAFWTKPKTWTLRRSKKLFRYFPWSTYQFVSFPYQSALCESNFLRTILTKAMMYKIIFEITH